MPLLSETELKTELETLPGWTFVNGAIVKTYEFDSYAHGLAFAGACGFLAERWDHHPDMLITWRKVQVTLSTHSAGGVSGKDVFAAREFDRVYGADKR